jgi:type IV pilus assembly protein PilF
MGLFIAVGCLGCAGGPSEEDIHRSEAEYELAVGLMGESNFAGAFQHLGEAIRLDPDNAEAHLLLGNLHLFRGDYAESERELLAAIDANVRLERAGLPSLTPDAKNSLGVVYIHTGRFDDAVRVLTESSSDLMNTTPHLALGNLGWANLERDDYGAALEALTLAVRREPQFCAGWFRLGQVYVAGAATDTDPTSSYVHAEEALTRALEVDAEVCQAFQDAWLLRGEVRTHLGRPEDAAGDFERCVELDGSSDAGHACARALDGVPASGTDTSAPSGEPSAAPVETP